MNRVINFHAVRNMDWFERVIILLKTKYHMISAADIISFYAGEKALKNSCLITVDDGDATSYDIIYPVLKKHNVPAIFFVSPLIAKREEATNFWFQEIRNCDENWCRKYAQAHFTYLEERQKAGNDNFFSMLAIDDIWEMIHRCKEENHLEYLTPQNMTVAQIQQIDHEGLVAIGAHTMWHPFLAAVSDERSRWEIEESVSELSKMLGHQVELFAYPNGRPEFDFGEREMDTLTKLGCKVSFSTHPRGFRQKDNPLAIPRFGLTYGSMKFVRMKLLLGNYYSLLRSLYLHVKNIIK